MCDIFQLLLLSLYSLAPCEIVIEAGNMKRKTSAMTLVHTPAYVHDAFVGEMRNENEDSNNGV